MKKIIALCVLTLLISGCSDEVNSEEPTQPLSELDQSISNSIMENFGHRHEFTEDAVELLEFDETTGKMEVIALTYIFEDESYADFKAEILASCASVLQDIKRQSEVTEVDFIVAVPVLDEDGNQMKNLEGKPMDNMTIFNMEFERKNLKNINFNELDPLKLKEKANFYFEALHE
ncbi:hypothetical protein M9R32_13175 [Paenisporosarcina quisquiliarum]|uniref:Lipoprotein n=1 Tax=Paenisporosarcina quisquiliarum TaxID=365346 RepID=A0A9X3RF01_9BACL|nr:hypothetical protein [Paenisporosarcina quisquiliarum]MCZ8538142.1 hypothetical protein [Paenisporosarcina quisquiliarum]